MPKTLKKIAETAVAFGDVVQLSKTKSKDPEADGFERYLGLEHLEPSDLKVRSWGYIADGTTFTNVFRPGQVLFGKRRAYQRKVAVPNFSGVCSGDIYVLEPKGDHLVPELLAFICQSEPFYDYVISMSQGGLSPRVNWKALAKYEFALPPLEEQRRIAEVLQAIEKAEESLSRIELELKQLFRMTISEILNLEVASEPKLEEVPSGWSIARLDELTHPDRPISYGILKPGGEDPQGTPMLRVLDFDKFGFRTDTIPSKVAHEVAETSKTTYLREGDVLVSIMATIGRVFLVPAHMRGWNVNRALAVLPSGGDVSGDYLEAYLQSDFVQRMLYIHQLGSAQSRINLEFLRALPVPVPPGDIRAKLVEERRNLGTALQSVWARREETQKLKKCILEETVN